VRLVDPLPRQEFAAMLLADVGWPG
jgi:hypothetical protein